MPTECTPDLFGSAPVEGGKLVANFDGGDLSSDVGALLLGALDDRGAWPEDARRAALAISGSQEKDLSLGKQLLQAIKDAFDQDASDKLSRDKLLN
jgi:Protein of unknown function (DUF3631)